MTSSVSEIKLLQHKLEMKFIISKFRLNSGCWEHLGLCVLPRKVPYGYFKGYGSTLCVLSFEVPYVYFYAISVCVLSWKYPMSPPVGGLYVYFVIMEVPYVDFH